jgi:peptidoglycan-associated lipoprotein
LQLNPEAVVVIEGHADERGTREYNLALGDRRASAARDFLLAKGIDAARIRTVSYGKERPLMSGSNETSWAKNRRAATVLN